ncbi:MAG: carbohydrate binding domain-containing protein [Gemmatimonas sp.]
MNARRMTPGMRTPALSKTPVRDGLTQSLGPAPSASFALRVMIWFAVLQGAFFLLPLALPSSRLLGIALALLTLLSARLLQGVPSRRAAWVAVLAVLIGANFVAHLLASAPNFPFRIAQLTVLVGYVLILLSAAMSLVGATEFKRAFVGIGTAAALFVIAEGLIGGRDDFAPNAGKVQWLGTVVQDSAIGARFAPNSLIKSVYPDNPRGYFDEPDALQRRWLLETFEGSQARLEFPADQRGVLRVKILDAPGKQRWHIALLQAPLRVQLDERYEVRFRARADSVRTIFLHVGQARKPFDGRGLFREIRLDTTWRDVSESFRATATDRDARLFFELGADASPVEFANITMRAISTNRAVEAPARRELSVSYQINSQGCRGADSPTVPSPGTWRILALGDGNAFGVGVHQGDTFSARLETMLNEAGTRQGTGDRFDVINCSMLGFSTENEKRLLRALAPHYSPNVVLLAVSPDDDRFTSEFESGAAKDSSGLGLQRLSRIWGLISAIGRPKATPPDFPAVVRGIREIEQDASARGSRLAVILFRHRETREWAGLDSAVTIGLRGTNIPVLDLGSALRSFSEAQLRVHAIYDGHPNELAHRVSAEAIRKFLADEGLLGHAPK